MRRRCEGEGALEGCEGASGKNIIDTAEDEFPPLLKIAPLTFEPTIYDQISIITNGGAPDRRPRHGLRSHFGRAHVRKLRTGTIIGSFAYIGGGSRGRREGEEYRRVKKADVEGKESLRDLNAPLMVSLLYYFQLR